MLLNKFLSNFSYTAVQRSLEYLSHIDYGTIQFSPFHGHIMMAAKIKGTHDYHTHIIYNPTKNAIKEISAIKMALSISSSVI